MNTCETCTHWLRPEQRTGFTHVITVYPDGYHAARLKAESDAADRLFGQCRAINLTTDVQVSEPIPLAVTRDASEYQADLYTQATFGCAMWEPKP